MTNNKISANKSTVTNINEINWTNTGTVVSIFKKSNRTISKILKNK